MLKNRFYNLVIFIFSLFIFTSFFNISLAKPLYIEICGGENLGIPIAVVPSSSNNFLKLNPNEDIFSVVKNDLRNSGQFKVIKNIFNSSIDDDNVDNSLWKTRGAEFLIIGKILKAPRNKFDIMLKVINVYKDDNIPLLHLKFSNQNRKNFRALAHHISDKVFETLIGIRGVFSTKIAYITVNEEKHKTIHTLTVADSDGFNDKALIKTNYPMMSPSWSKDGKKIAFVSFQGKHSSIKMVDLTNGNITQLARYKGINGAPAWSYDNKYLALVLSKDGSPNIYVLNLHTQELTRLTKGNFIDTEPHWMPDNKHIVFTSNRNGRPHIYKINVETLKVKRLTFEGRYNARPSVTPDGKNLIMMHQTNNGRFNIAVQSLQTGELKILTGAKQDESPTLAPNGMMVLYGSKYANNYILGAVSIDGNFHMRLPLHNENVKDPSWSPYLLGNS